MSVSWISDGPRELVSVGAIVFLVHFGFWGIPSCSNLSVTCHSVWVSTKKQSETDFTMVLKGNALYMRALIGGSLGFVTFGWDAGVLGGVLLTNEFQSAMGVSLHYLVFLTN